MTRRLVADVLAERGSTEPIGEGLGVIRLAAFLIAQKKNPHDLRAVLRHGALRAAHPFQQSASALEHED